MLSERREQERAVVLDPELAASARERTQAGFALVLLVRWLQVLRAEPAAVAAALGGLGDGALCLHTKEKVDGGLLIGVW